MAAEFTPDCPVEAIHRATAGDFKVQKAQVQEAAGSSNGGAQRILAANPKRIAAWFYCPQGNTGNVYIGGPDLGTSSNNETNGFDTEPGTGWWIEDLRGELWAVAAIGVGAQWLKFFEAVRP